MTTIALFERSYRRRPMQGIALAACIALHAIALALLLMTRSVDPSAKRIAPLMWVTIRELPQLPPASALPSPAFSAPTLSFPLPSAPEMREITTPWVSKGLELQLPEQDCETSPDRQKSPCPERPTRAATSQRPALSAELMQKFAHDKEIEDSPLLAPCFSSKLRRFSSSAC